MALNRRQFLQSGVAGMGLAIAGDAHSLFPGAPRAARSASTGYGGLVSDPARLLDLPEGFSYTVVSRTGDPLTAGVGTVPDQLDWMGLFTVASGNTVLVRNSEQSGETLNPVVAAPEFTYDPAAMGGTTTTELGADFGVVAEYVSLAGTIINCAGGVTPWGTWLSCEETGATVAEGQFSKDHGWVFEVDPVTVGNNADPTPLEGLGRFPHEAVSVDPATGTLYLTEDAGDPNGVLYRATPNRPLGGYGSLRAGATLEALVATDGGTLVADLAASLFVSG